MQHNITTTDIYSPLTPHPPIAICGVSYEKNACKIRFCVYTWIIVIKQIILLNNKNNQAQHQQLGLGLRQLITRRLWRPNKYFTFLNCNKCIHNECLSRHRVIIILRHTSVDTMSRGTHIANYLVFIISIFERLLTRLKYNIILFAIFLGKSNAFNERIYLHKRLVLGSRGLTRFDYFIKTDRIVFRRY